jgi:hypothetical protein
MKQLAVARQRGAVIHSCLCWLSHARLDYATSCTTAQTVCTSRATRCPPACATACVEAVPPPPRPPGPCSPWRACRPAAAVCDAARAARVCGAAPRADRGGGGQGQPVPAQASCQPVCAAEAFPSQRARGWLSRTGWHRRSRCARCLAWVLIRCCHLRGVLVLCLCAPVEGLRQPTFPPPPRPAPSTRLPLPSSVK